MAINKVSNNVSKNHSGLKNLVSYVLNFEKTHGQFIEVTGPYESDSIDADTITKEWVREKRLWGKDFGRMYAHNIISFHKYENITPEQVLRIALRLTRMFFREYQCLIAVHQDKNHLHAHIITNTVSFVSGKKMHQTKYDLQAQKDFTNDICREMGLSVAEKGRHFDGTEIEQGEIMSWDKNKYKLLVNSEKKSYLVDLAVAITEAKTKSYSREEFISSMKEAGWDVIWTESRKYITFIQQGTDKRVRDINISKTFNMTISKEALEHEFERKAEQRQQLQSAGNYRNLANQIGRSAGQNQSAGVHHSRV